ncbi:hypothetical protein SAMN06265795_1321, partial [Noviherbaspirillum humi]
SYAIVPSGQSSSNYAISFVAGNLTIGAIPAPVPSPTPLPTPTPVEPQPPGTPATGIISPPPLPRFPRLITDTPTSPASWIKTAGSPLEAVAPMMTLASGGGNVVGHESHLTQICFSAATLEADPGGCMGKLAGASLPDATLSGCGRPDSVTARRVDGAALPSWLTFDEKALRFSAIDPPPGALPLPVELNIRWPQGGEARIRTLVEACHS